MSDFEHDFGIVYSGGGFRGMVQLPHVQRFGRRAKVLAGTSVGILNASMASAGLIEELTTYWEEIDGISGFMSLQLDIWNGAYSLNPLRKKMEEVGVMEQLEKPTYAGVYNFQSRRSRGLHLNPFSPEERINIAIASASIDPVHEVALAPIRPGGPKKALGDGGWRDPLTPLPRSVWQSVGEWHFVFCTPPPRVRLPDAAYSEVSNTLERTLHGLEELIRRGNAACWNRIRAWAKQRPDIKMVAYAPEDWEGIGETFEAPRDLQISRYKVGQQMLDNPIPLN